MQVSVGLRPPQPASFVSGSSTSGLLVSVAAIGAGLCSVFVDSVGDRFRSAADGEQAALRDLLDAERLKYAQQCLYLGGIARDLDDEGIRGHINDARTEQV